MTRVFVDPTTLVDLGQVGEIDHLTAVDGDLVVPDAVAAEVTTDPAATNLDRFLADSPVETGPCETDWTDEAMEVLGVADPTSEVRILEGVLAATDAAGGTAGSDDEGDGGDAPPAGLVSEDRRLRTLAEGFGATVTGTFGVVVRAASEDKYISATQAKRIVRRIDSHGLHLTGEMREQAVGSAES